MLENTPDTETIPQMVDDVRAGKISRRKLITALAAIGLSATGISVLAEATSHAQRAAHVPVKSNKQESEQNLHLHDRHLAHQVQNDTHALQHDYADNAIVEDSMYDRPFIGRDAIMVRKGTGMAAITDLKINVTNRVAQAHQVTVEWIATGTHTGDFPNLPATGRTFAFSGVTVVVRNEGKIVRESIYYDMKEVYRQLGPK
jgi:steroid delta-isomerase-like uncharacterized protein